MEKTKLSIIIPAKNEERFIGQCIGSAKKAIHKWQGRAEIILIDNGSTDHTRRIAEENGCIVIEELKGPISRLRNIGALNAQGDILAFLDADCIVPEDWITFCLQNFNNPNIAATGTRAVPDFMNATWVEKAWYKLVSGAQRPDFVEWLGTSNFFVRKEVFNQVGGFDEKLETGEDVDLSYRIRKNYRIFLEKRIDTIHLRESKTLKELFKREFWRGKGTLRVFFQNRFSIKDLPSVVTPVIIILSTLALFLFASLRSVYTTIPLAINFLFPVLFLIKKRVKAFSFEIFFHCYMVAAIYLYARSLSLVYESYSIVFKEKAGRVCS